MRRTVRRVCVEEEGDGEEDGKGDERKILIISSHFS